MPGLPGPSRRLPTCVFLSSRELSPLPALAVTEDVLQSAETRLQSTEPGPEFVVFFFVLSQSDVSLGYIHAAEESVPC